MLRYLDESCLSNGYLDTIIDWIPAMEGIRLKDLPTFIRTTNRDDIMFNYNLESVNNALKTGSIILNTFDDLEQDVLDAMKSKFPDIYTVGPLSLLSEQITCDAKMESVEASLWKEDDKCLEWLDKRDAGSVVYVNYGSLIIMTPKQLREFAWGLANSKYSFLWVIRPNLVNGGTEIISQDFLNEIKDRGLILDWCPQEKSFRPPFNWRVLNTLWVEFYFGKHFTWGAHDLLAIFCRTTNELPLLVLKVGDWSGD